MFCHFIIHNQFEHGLSHSRANGSGSEEPDSALSDNLAVHRNGPVWSVHDSGPRACSGWVGSCFILTPLVNRKNTVLLAPVQSARDLTVQERSMPKSETLVGNGMGHTGPVHWFQLSISALARFDLWELNGEPGKLCSCERVPIPVKPAQLKTRTGLVKRLPPGQRKGLWVFPWVT